MYLILCCNDENIKQLLYIFVPIIVSNPPTKHLELCLIVPNFKVPNCYNPHNKYVVLIGDISTD